VLIDPLSHAQRLVKIGEEGVHIVGAEQRTAIDDGLRFGVAVLD